MSQILAKSLQNDPKELHFLVKLTTACNFIKREHLHMRFS